MFSSSAHRIYTNYAHVMRIHPGFALIVNVEIGTQFYGNTYVSNTLKRWQRQTHGRQRRGQGSQAKLSSASRCLQ